MHAQFTREVDLLTAERELYQADFAALDAMSVDFSLSVATTCLGDADLEEIASITWMQPALLTPPGDHLTQQEAQQRIL